MKGFTFKGGIHPIGKKELTSEKAIEVFPASKLLYISLHQHIGPALEPLVKVGDSVKEGSKIADNQAFMTAPVHVPVSGKVVGIEDRQYSIHGNVKVIIIENDGKEEKENISGTTDYTNRSSEELLKIIREKGVVGLGGAAFPTHVKLTQPKDKIDTLLINGAECEPYLNTDNRVMAEYHKESIEGIKILMHILGVKKAVIGIENNKKKTLNILKDAIAGNPEIEVKELDTKYPQGGEKQLIKALINREVPPRKLPAEIGVVVSNIGTAKAVYDAVVLGKPLIERVITVSGGGITEPKNILVKIGIPIKEILSVVGYDREKTEKLILGGPMMGIAQFNEEAPVVKGTSGIVALTKEEIRPYRAKNCINCGKCVDVCPMSLIPLMYPKLASRNQLLKMEETYKLMDCIECGACSYICPANRPLVESIRVGKAKLRNMKK